MEVKIGTDTALQHKHYTTAMPCCLQPKEIEMQVKYYNNSQNTSEIL